MPPVSQREKVQIHHLGSVEEPGRTMHKHQMRYVMIVFQAPSTVGTETAAVACTVR